MTTTLIFLTVRRVMLLLGFVLLALGIVGDVNKYWDDLGYSTNMLASLTAACFGIPFAVFLLSKFIQAQGEIRERQQLLDQAERLIAAIRNSLEGMTADHAHDFSIALSEARVRLEAAHQPTDPDQDFREPERVTDALTFVTDAASYVMASSVGATGYGMMAWDIARSRWRYVHEVLLLKAEGLELPIMGALSAFRLQQQFGSIIPPVQVIGGPLGSLVIKPANVDRIRAKVAEGTATMEDYEGYLKTFRETDSILREASTGFFELGNIYNTIVQVQRDIKEQKHDFESSQRRNLFQVRAPRP